MSSTAADPKTTHVAGKVYYRPELDALRFFAFLCVLVHHGGGRGGAFTIVRRAGGFGLPLFFLLSAFLITSLLLREREEQGTVHLKSFYIRRILRIWPLYYAALIAAVLIGKIPPHQFAVSHPNILGLALFIENWMPRNELIGLLGPLWSISVEEQYYLIWPLVTKLGGARAAVVVSWIFILGSALTMTIHSADTWMLWYSTFVEFLFFGSGALLAVIFRARRWRASSGFRLLLLFSGLACWLIAAGIGRVGSDHIPGVTLPRLYLGYGAADAGCILIFLSFMGATGIPRTLAYLGRISYGLYVFMFGMVRLSSWLMGRILGTSDQMSLLAIAALDGLAFVLCVCAASISYRYLEKPFLQLKERFTFIHSRPV